MQLRECYVILVIDKIYGGGILGILYILENQRCSTFWRPG